MYLARFPEPNTYVYLRHTSYYIPMPFSLCLFYDGIVFGVSIFSWGCN